MRIKQRLDEVTRSAPAESVGRLAGGPMALSRTGTTGTLHEMWSDAVALRGALFLSSRWLRSALLNGSGDHLGDNPRDRPHWHQPSSGVSELLTVTLPTAASR